MLTIRNQQVLLDRDVAVLYGVECCCCAVRRLCGIMSAGIDLEYRDGADKPLYHCKRPVLRLEAEIVPITAMVTAASERACACLSHRETTRRRKSWRCNIEAKKN